jgi:hypothetical protein
MRGGKRNEPCPDRAATCPSPCVEQTVEAVKIREDGTRCAAGGAGTPEEGGNVDREWTHGMEPVAGIQRGRSPGEANQETDSGWELARRR